VGNDTPFPHVGFLGEGENGDGDILCEELKGSVLRGLNST
jgi:hypothetical protein